MVTFLIHARAAPETLSRVVLLFHRRRILIDSLVAQRDEKSGLQRIEVTTAEEETRAGLIEANLYKLVDVILVEKKRDV